MQKLLVDKQDISVLLDLNEQTISKHLAGIRRCPRLKGIPEPVERRPRLLWWLADIEAWAESRRTFKPAPAAPVFTFGTAEVSLPKPQKRKIGRPRKSENLGGVV